MFRLPSASYSSSRSFPHARGDVPSALGAHALITWFSPRPWGCSGFNRLQRLIIGVFPTPVGMFPPFSKPDAPPAGFPHARGDVPEHDAKMRPLVEFSPRPWGCSAGRRIGHGADAVFPTPVGMFRSETAPDNRSVSFPHARGDVPCKQLTDNIAFQFSPRPWGCSGIF